MFRNWTTVRGMACKWSAQTLLYLKSNMDLKKGTWGKKGENV